MRICARVFGLIWARVLRPRVVCARMYSIVKVPLSLFWSVLYFFLSLSILYHSTNENTIAKFCRYRKPYFPAGIGKTAKNRVKPGVFARRIGKSNPESPPPAKKH